MSSAVRKLACAAQVRCICKRGVMEFQSDESCTASAILCQRHVSAIAVPAPSLAPVPSLCHRLRQCHASAPVIACASAIACARAVLVPCRAYACHPCARPMCHRLCTAYACHRLCLSSPMQRLSSMLAIAHACHRLCHRLRLPSLECAPDGA